MSKSVLPLVTVKMAVSPTCNLSCAYCDGPTGYRSTLGAMEDFRRKPVIEGSLSADGMIEIARALAKEGVGRLSLTGGEPLINRDWDRVATESARAGFLKVSLNTNGILLSDYLQKHNGKLPYGLKLIKISVDSFDPVRFNKVTGGGDLERVIAGVKEIKSNKVNNGVKVRANKVVLRSDLTGLSDYIVACEKAGFDEVNFLDLVFYRRSNREAEKKFFVDEYLPFSEIDKHFSKVGLNFISEERYGTLFHQAKLASGFRIIFKDSTQTMRNELCSVCTEYCQGGICVIYVGTDGNITPCPDYYGKLPSFNGIEEIRKHTFGDRVRDLDKFFTLATSQQTMGTFCDKNNIVFPEKVCL